MDLAFIKDIDFTNPGNIIFALIAFGIFLVAFVICLLVLAKIVKAFKRIFRGIFRIDAKKPKFGQKESSDWVHDEVKQKEAVNMPRQKAAGGDFLRGDAIKKTEPTKEDVKKAQQEKEKKDIAGQLSKLKGEGDGQERVMGSRLPSRSEKSEDKAHDRIHIPRPYYQETRRKSTLYSKGR